METKTYFASSVPAALEMARKELGREAMLVGSRPSSGDGRAYGRLEVTFTYERGQKFPTSQGPIGAWTRPSAATAPTGLGEIREELEALRTAIRTNPGGGIRIDPAQGIIDRLKRGGMVEETAKVIAESALQRSEATEIAVRLELENVVRVRPFVPMKPGESRSLAFVGQPGRGKSTSLVKIAMRYGIAARIPTRIYSAGVHPVGGAEQMARYAAILGVPFNWYETLDSLHLALNGDRWRGLALIDTPGISQVEVEELAGWERVFRLHPDMERHLVLRADARSADISSVLSRLDCLSPTHLLFTGLDEAVDYGVLIESAIHSQLPLCFAAGGPRIPEDIAVIDCAALIRSVWAEQSRAAAA